MIWRNECWKSWGVIQNLNAELVSTRDQNSDLWKEQIFTFFQKPIFSELWGKQKKLCITCHKLDNKKQINKKHVI